MYSRRVLNNGQAMKATIIIPTYWRGPAADGGACELVSDYVYDTATPLDEQGTLGRALESLSVLDTEEEFAVVVVAVPSRTELKQSVELRVRLIVAEFEHRYPIMVIGPDEIRLWRQRLADKGLFQYDHFLSLDGAAQVRNVCLLAASLTGADVAVMFSDDVVYDDPQYIRKALEFVGGHHEGSFVGGVTGYYRRNGDSPRVPSATDPWQEKWGDIESINDTLRLVDREPRLKKSPFACGGNMVIHRDVYENIPFDPNIPRGESADYLMNARLFGYDFFLDSELWIRLEERPPGCAPAWHRLRLDIIRFARERAKLLAPRGPADGLARPAPEDFDPYPGRFLKDNLHDIVFETSMEMAGDYYDSGREDDAGECIMNIAISKAEAVVKTDPLSDYIAYQRLWQEFIGIVPQLGIWHPENTSD